MLTEFGFCEKWTRDFIWKGNYPEARRVELV